jgi:hypothetical protein
VSDPEGIAARAEPNCAFIAKLGWFERVLGEASVRGERLSPAVCMGVQTDTYRFEPEVEKRRRR